MGSEWIPQTLREAGVSLIDCEHKTPPENGVGYPYIAIPQLKNGHIDPTDARKISKSDFELWTRKAKPQEHDVILSRRCNPGETAIVMKGIECALGQNLVLLRSDGKRVFPPFLRWLTRGPEWWEQVGKFLNVGAIFDSLKCADVPNFVLSIPPIITQQRIAETLGSLDDKIELNRKTNETLEAMAKALFKSWFVDFDPVREKATGRTPQGLDPEIANLFPDSFEDSPLGPIPKGWKLEQLGDVAENVSRSFDFSQNNTPVFINTGDVLSGDFLHSDCTPKSKLPGQAKKALLVDDILFTEIRPANRRFAFVHFDPKNYVVSTKFMVIRSKGGISQRLLYRILTTDETLSIFQTVAESRSGTFPQITFDSVSFLPCVLAPKPLQDAFQLRVDPIESKILAIKKESRTLADIRDSLLPKLMSGEIPV